MLSLDHTYKCVAPLGVKKECVAPPGVKQGKKWKWIQLKSSLLLILNEFGCILDWTITPNETREFVQNALMRIWKTPGREVVTEQVSTDDSAKDTNCIEKAFRKCHPEEAPLVKVSQDVWHAEQRVLTPMHKYHASYRTAKYSFQAIFATLKKKEFERKEDFVEAIKNWMDQYKQTTLRSKMNKSQLLKSVGM
jgi:hypothetical protein